MKSLLKRRLTEQEAQQIVQLLDGDKDGRVRMEDVLELIKKGRSEVAELEEQTHAAQSKEKDTNLNSGPPSIMKEH